jgi:hypothetical protein
MSVPIKLLTESRTCETSCEVISSPGEQRILELLTDIPKVPLRFPITPPAST